MLFNILFKLLKKLSELFINNSDCLIAYLSALLIYLIFFDILHLSYFYNLNFYVFNINYLFMHWFLNFVILFKI